MLVSEITLGSWLFGAKNWGNVNDKDSLKVIHRSLEYGINFFDTAPIYGFGHSEKILGSALKPFRANIYISSKCGLLQAPSGIIHGLKKESIWSEIHSTLKNLQTDYLDIYHVHWPDPEVPTEEVMNTLLDIKSKGLIKHIGFCNHPLEELRKAMSIGTVDCIQDQYSLLQRAVEKDILPFTKKENLGFMAYGVLHGGLLTGKYSSIPHPTTKEAKNFFYGINQENLWLQATTILDNLRNTNPELPCTNKAISWVLKNEPVSTAIIGFRNLEQLDAVLQDKPTQTVSQYTKRLYLSFP